MTGEFFDVRHRIDTLTRCSVLKVCPSSPRSRCSVGTNTFCVVLQRKGDPSVRVLTLTWGIC